MARKHRIESYHQRLHKLAERAPKFMTPARRLARGIWRKIRQKAFERECHHLLPAPFHPAARFVFDQRLTAEETRLAEEIESLRDLLPLRYGGEHVVYPSPRAGDFHVEGSVAAAGPARADDIHELAHVGASPHVGTLLARIAAAARAGGVLELGTNTGFSAAYLAASDTSRHVVTVEGSADLCRIAKDNVARLGADVQVLNMLFDEAIDLLAAEGHDPFDLVFLDGQHEPRAVLHYTGRLMPLLRPGGVYVLDDIYWSQGMNDAWREVRDSVGFDITVDFGRVGVCILPERDRAGRGLHVDISAYAGRPRIFKPGW